MVLGSLFEGETVVLAAGFAAYRGYLDIHWVLLAAFAGAFTGDQIYFHLGAWKGAGFLEKRALWREHAGKVRRLLKRYGVLVILGFRFIYGARTVTPLVIGSSGFSSRMFLLLNGLSAIVWCCVVAWLGYAFGAFTQSIFSHIEKYEKLIMLLVIAMGAAIWTFNALRKWRAARKKAAPASPK